VHDIRAAVLVDTPVVNARFQQHVEKALHYKVKQAKGGGGRID
jgi:hypothetical protein